VMQLLAICQVQRRKFAEAAALFSKLLPSDDPSILIGAATSYIETGRSEEANSLLEKLLSVQPDSPQTHFLVGLAHYNRQNYPEAEESLKRMLQISPESPEGHFYLGANYFKQDKHDAAAAEWRSAIGASPAYFPALFALGVLLSSQGKYD